MRLFLYIILGCFIISPAFSQSIKKANKKNKRGEYQAAITSYEKLLNNPKHKAESNFQIAEAYRLTNRIKKAKSYYQAAIKSGYKNAEVFFYYGLSLKANGMYTQAEDQIARFIRSENINEDIAIWAEKELENLVALKAIEDKESYYRVKALDVINTPSAEYSPVYKDGELYFTSNRDSERTYKATGTGFTNIYKAKTNGARVDTTTIEKLNELINSENANEGSVTFSPDGKSMVFAKGNTGKRKGAVDINLYISRLRNRMWSEPRLLSISRGDSWDSSPAFSRDGRTLYFSSNRKTAGSYGGTDLYSAKMDARGRFGKVKNLGGEINTPGNEMFPYIANDGTLYFSSDGQPGYGGLDLFTAKRRSGVISIENLGQPVNSSSDDFGIYLFKADRGFFTSNRPEGKGDDDVWTFVNDDPNLKTVNYFLKGKTMTHLEEEDPEILGNVKVFLIDYQGDVLDEMVTGKEGEFNFRLYENENYTLLAEKEGAEAQEYYVTRLDYTTVGKAVDQESLVNLVNNITYDTLIFLDKIIIDKSIVLENIYYDFNKWDIRADAAVELDKLTDILNDNPGISIELSSHTDSVANDAYNQRLSQRRAESAVRYIVASGIESNRITAKGYGESMPIARNTNPDGTDNPEGRQQNRRTEFKVTDYNYTEKASNSEDDDYLDEDRYFQGNNGLEE